MLKRIAVVGGVVAVVGLGVGGAASAWSGAPVAQAAVAGSIAGAAAPASSPSPTTGASPTASASAGTAAGKGTGTARQHDRKALVKRLAGVSHAQWVSRDRETGAFVTHDAVRGNVAAASAGSITVTATDGSSETFVVNGSTKVRVAGTKDAATMTQVKVGDRVTVLGTGSGTMTATHIVDRGTKSPDKRTAGAAPSPSGSAAPSTTTSAPPTS